MTSITSGVATASDNLWNWGLTPIVIALALYFTLRTGFGQLTSVPQMFRTITQPAPRTADDKPQSISSFQAFTLSAASRVGVGNIAGVGTAIAIGGPGAVFWMWIMALFVGASSLIESSLAQLYKIKDPDRSFRGGPAYYIQQGLRSRPFAIAFAVALVLTFPFAFNSLQANTLTDAVVLATKNPAALTWAPFVVGAVLATLVGFSIFGGLHRIANISQTVMPAVAIAYLILGIVVVVMNYEQIPWAFSAIFESAFGIRQFGGAAIGTVIVQGVRRGMFSNEAGLGSVPNAAAAAAVTHPVKQGLVQTLGVYFDTWLVCSITAFIVLVSSPDLTNAPRGIYLTQHALATTLGSWTSVLLVVIIALLVFTSLLGNYYYGEANIRFISDNPRVLTGFRVLVIATVFLGCLAEVDLIWSLADGVMGIMALINMIAIALLSPIAFKLWKDYKSQLREGKDPVFTVDRIPGLHNVECWQSEQEVVGWGPGAEDASGDEVRQDL
ncbi:alanine/glycine:cation symporter family protein [Actinomyces minihominis]|uniref:alanine/glycine:cation symporter family protein n=1 Tax=Actinomyces minihominis TaxID=2002838 RepID=UPI000C076AFD|nr:alanine/glycine:cation symporter family protein [Actinomyces minihominis]